MTKVKFLIWELTLSGLVVHTGQVAGVNMVLPNLVRGRKSISGSSPESHTVVCFFLS